MSCVNKGVGNRDHVVLYLKHPNSWHSNKKKKKSSKFFTELLDEV